MSILLNKIAQTIKNYQKQNLASSGMCKCHNLLGKFDYMNT